MDSAAPAGLFNVTDRGKNEICVLLLPRGPLSFGPPPKEGTNLVVSKPSVFLSGGLLMATEICLFSNVMPSVPSTACAADT